MPTLTGLRSDLATILRHPDVFSARAERTKLRPYQVPVIQAIARSVRQHLGLTFVVIFPRQSGKNETQLSLYVYLLTHAQREGGDIIHVEPTYKPQTETAMFRLAKKLDACTLTRGKWKKQFGYIYSVGSARVVHFSGEPSANVVGSTAGLLISINEAQDILPSKYDKDFNPMGASTNATRVFWGTRWTSDTLLEREYKAALVAEEADGIRRTFFVTAEEVGKVLEPYRRFVDSEIKRLGRQHPLIRTQYFCETIDAQSGMFPSSRIMLMRGDHPRADTPIPGHTYAFCIDVGGQDEKSIIPDQLENPARDSTSLTIIDIDIIKDSSPKNDIVLGVYALGVVPGGEVAEGRWGSSPDLPAYQSPDIIPMPFRDFPIYRAVNRLSWLGEKHTTVFSRLRALHDLWHPQFIVIDATGVGEGLWSMLDTALPGKVLPVKFTEQEKSAIGYQLIQIIESCRYRDYSPFDETLLEQLQNCASEVRPGPAKSLKWGVPESRRNTNGQFLHDDLILSLSLISILDRFEWRISTPIASSEGFDPITIR